MPEQTEPVNCEIKGCRQPYRFTENLETGELHFCLTHLLDMLRGHQISSPSQNL